LKWEGCYPKVHYVWNDGCTGHFLINESLVFCFLIPFIKFFEDLLVGYDVVWNFSAIGHGKGEIDEVKALLKIEVQKEQIKPQGQKLQNAKEICKFLIVEINKYHVAHPKARREINKFFWNVNIGEVDKSKSFDCETVCGNYGMH
jgi:hypothetical protein